VESLRRREFIDYSCESDFTKNGKAPFIFDAVGKHSFMRCRRSLNRAARTVTDGLLNAFFILWTRWVGDRRVSVPPIPAANRGRWALAVVDRCYPPEDVVEATRYVETGQKTGNGADIEGGRTSRRYQDDDSHFSKRTKYINQTVAT